MINFTPEGLGGELFGIVARQRLRRRPARFLRSLWGDEEPSRELR